MKKGIVGALVLTGSLLVGPAALAAPVEPSGNLPSTYTPQHAGHDHGKKDEPKKKYKKAKKYKKSKHSHGYGHDHGHHHRHHGDDDSAHASGGYDSHRHHPRNW